MCCRVKDIYSSRFRNLKQDLFQKNIIYGISGLCMGIKSILKMKYNYDIYYFTESKQCTNITSFATSSASFEDLA